MARCALGLVRVATGVKPGSGTAASRMSHDVTYGRPLAEHDIARLTELQQEKAMQ